MLLGSSSPRALLLLLLAVAQLAPSSAIVQQVREVDGLGLQRVVGRHKRLMVLMHDGPCIDECKVFQPWLHAIANLVPHLPMAKLDVSRDGRAVAGAFGVSGGLQIKLFKPKNAEGKRVIDYTGPLEFDAVLSWCRAVGADEEHENSEYATEPPGMNVGESGGTGSSGRTSTGTGSPAMGKLPESVRAMATAMVRETRIQRLLKEQGPGRAEHYDAMVRQKYAEILAEERPDMTDKFAVQEANRKAREHVQGKILKEAPQHIREEVEAEVRLGDAADQKREQPRQLKSGSGDSKKSKSKGASKDEL